ncbi:MAG: hypothetical protein ACLPX7_22525 [Xanthobacteraceae bacterium]
MQNTAEGMFPMTNLAHKFKVGQIVDLIPSMSRSAARGHYEIVSLRPTDGESPQYRIKSRSEAHERVVAETDLILSAHLKFD